MGFFFDEFLHNGTQQKAFCPFCFEMNNCSSFVFFSFDDGLIVVTATAATGGASELIEPLPLDRDEIDDVDVDVVVAVVVVIQVEVAVVVIPDASSFSAI